MMSSPSSVMSTEGKIEFVVSGKTYYTWYKLVGDLKSGTRPLIALHGGPAAGHYYLLTLTDLFTTYGRTVIFYDQLGNANSTHLPLKGRDFWTPALFMDELENLITHLNISDEFDLLGHSWGGMLASQFAAERAPAGLRHIVIADSLAAMPLWVQSLRMLMSGMPQEMQDAFKRHEEAGTTGSEECAEEVMNEFNARHMCRVKPIPELLMQTLQVLSDDPTVVTAMLDSPGIEVNGTLKTWSIVDQLHKITVPTLLLNGRYDEASHICMSPFFNHIPKVKWYTFAESSHVPHLESEREHYMEIVNSFLSL